MHNNNLKDSILEKIENEHITPTPAWHFAVQHSILWIPGTLVTIVGACAWAGMLFGWENAGFEYERFVAPNKMQFLLNTMPLIWVFSFVLFALVIVQTLRLTPKGYRFNTKKVLAGSLLISIVLGTIMYIVDMRGYRNPIIRYPVERQHRRLWSHPENGIIAGLVDIQETSIVVTDFNNKQWILNTAFLPTTTPLTDGMMLRFVGKKIDEDNFLVCMVLPWNLSLRPAPPVPGQNPPPRMMPFGTSTNPHPCDLVMQH